MKQLLIHFTLLLFANVAIAQIGYNPPRYFQQAPGDEVFAAPDVQAFHKYAFIPENLYVGRVNLDIPIYQIQSGNISVPISLSYSSGGIKVSDIASNTGLGWNLNAGGSMMKIVRDLPDDEFYGTAYTWADDTGDNAGDTEGVVTQLGFHRFNSPVTINVFTNPVWFNQTYNPPFFGGAVKKADASPDFFHVNAPGLSTKFFLEDLNPNDKTTAFENRQYDAVFLDNSGVKLKNPISRSLSTMQRLKDLSYGNNLPDTHIDGTPFYNYDHLEFGDIEVVNTDGINYLFGTRDYSELSSRNVSRSVNKGLSTTNWNLDKITDLSNNKEVQFIYEEYFKADFEKRLNITTSNQVPTDDENELFFMQFLNVSLNSWTYDPVYGSFSNTFSPKLHRLKSIVWDQGSVDFIYGLPRLDDPSEEALTQIIIKNKLDQVVKEFHFTYSYLISKENCPEKTCKRLKLEKISEVSPSGSGEVREYTFNYYYNDPLPKRDSFQRDFLGYYNNNGFEWQPDGSGTPPPNPELHFYLNEGANAILPFQRSNGSDYRLIEGDYNLVPNEYSLSGMLKKVSYPTGGYSEFEYELHDFNFLGDQYNAGGARIKKQIIADGEGSIRELEYEYKNADGSSSGYINRIPVFGNINRLNGTGFSMNASAGEWSTYFTCYDKSKSDLELTEGNFVGYARVIKKETGNGYTEYAYSGSNAFPNEPETTENPFGNFSFFLNNNNYPALYTRDLDIRRGKILSEKIFAENDDLLVESNYLYNYKVFDTIQLSYTTSVYGSPFLQGGGEVELGHSSSFHIERNLNEQVITTTYTPNGLKTVSSDMLYDPELPLVKEKKTVNSKGEEETETFYYPFDPEVSGLPLMSTLIDQNRIAQAIDVEVSDETATLFSERVLYEDFGGLILPQKVQTALGDEALEERINYQDYDSFGNPLEFSKADGTPVCYIWGYGNTLPIAKLEGIVYSDIDPATIANLQLLSDNDQDAVSEQTLRDALNALRSSYPGVPITTITYDPLIGVTSITDSRGHNGFYHYDDFNRLSTVKDANSNILETHNYNYKEQTDPLAPLNAVINYGNEDTGHQWFSADISGGSANYSYAWYEGTDDTSTNFEANASGTADTYQLMVDCANTKYVKLVVTDNTNGEIVEQIKVNNNTCPYPSLTVSVTYGTHSDTHQSFVSMVNGGSGNVTYTWYKGVGTSSFAFEVTPAGMQPNYSLTTSCTTYKWVKLVVTDTVTGESVVKVTKSNNSPCSGGGGGDPVGPDPFDPEQ